MWLHTFLAILLLAPTWAGAASVVVVQGENSSYGRRFFCGFSSSATERLAAFQYEAKKDDALVSRIKKLSPDLVFTLGDVPLDKLVPLLPATPFIVGGTTALAVAQKANVVLLDSLLPSGAGLSLINALFPEKKTIGTIYDPKYSTETFDALVPLTGKLGMKLAAIKVDNSADIKSFINAFIAPENKIDLLYWIHDATTGNDEALDAIYGFAKQNGIPVVTSDPGHMERGALLSFAVDPFELGQEAWKIAATILKQKKIPQMPVRVSSGQLAAYVSFEAAGRFGATDGAFHQFLQDALKEGYSVRVVK